MHIPTFLEAIGRNTGPFPRHAIEHAVRQRDGIIPELLGLVENVLDDSVRIIAEEPDYIGHVVALYLLAQFRETRAYPLMVRMARFPGRMLHALVGELMAEDFGRVLASVYGNDITRITTLIESDDVNDRARGNAIEALKLLVATSDKPRDDIMAYYKTLFEGGLERRPSYAWNTLIACATRLHPEELYDHIVAAYHEGLVQNFFMTPDDVAKVLRIDKGKTLDRLSVASPGYIDDTTQEPGLLRRFNTPRETRTDNAANPRRDVLSGMSPPSRAATAAAATPNAPCPCGSGKKHKKCCGRMG